MHRLKTSLKYFRLTLIFALTVFTIMLATMCFVFVGTHLLVYIGWIEARCVDRFPLFLFCLMSVVIGTVLSVIFNKTPLRPLRELMDATDKIAEVLHRMTSWGAPVVRSATSKAESSESLRMTIPLRRYTHAV